ncbi:MAG: phospholipase [Cytophagaceae bacterium SCN 52-12]|nr:MAG: phospholipase [Cytophagaceae bacterium SCN 52-12]
MSHPLDIKQAGAPPERAEKALIMLHGRGGSAADILTLSQFLAVEDFTLLAPQATNNTWYPLSFLAPVEDNEPWLSSALDIVQKTVDHAMEAGIRRENVYFFGFSQGACLALEFLARRAGRFGGAVALIGGVIGKTIDRSNYKGDFLQMPLLLSTSNPDFHVPVQRVYATGNIFRDMHAEVTEKVYDDMGHHINPEQMELANRVIFNLVK